jgi:hypothetical protein
MRTAPLASLPILTLLLLAACGRDDGRSARAADSARPIVATAPPVRAKPAMEVSRRVADQRSGAPEGLAATATTAAEQGASAPAPPPAEASPAGSATAPAEPAAAPSLVIRTGTASMEVDSLDRAVATVRAAVERIGGWVANSSVQGGNDQVRSATLELKIPAARFDALTGSLGTVGKLERLDVTAEDVGEEYVDVTARVANARRLEARLLALLERSAGRLVDVLSVERELARVREEIERYEGRLRWLRTRAAMSTLTLTVHEPPPLVAPHPGANPIAGALRDAWRNFVAVIAWLIASLGVIVPLGALAAGVWLAVRPALRRRPPHGDAPPPSPAVDAAEAPRRDRAA